MPLLSSEDGAALRDVAALLDCNPFVAERIEVERRILGDAFVPNGTIWHSEGDAYVSNPNTPLLRERIEMLVGLAHARFVAGATASEAESAAYHDAVLYLLWLRFEDDLYDLIEGEERTAGAPAVPWYDRFARELHALLDVLPGPPVDDAHIFAVGFQARRAFHHIFRQIFGGSLPAAHLRATLWKAIFSKDFGLYRTSRYARMRNVPVLITGESGTGKELVARAIAYSQFIPFDPQTLTFATDPKAGYFAVNLTALGSGLVESELFGHRKGAFTGADQERAGWLETCGPFGTVFVDEIGDVDPVVQVKLLRVLQTRIFQRMGETAARTFEGKVVAATNCDLQQAMDEGGFREDLYYRLRGVTIRTPSLREQLGDCPDDLGNLVFVLARRAWGDEEAVVLTDEVCAHIRERLGDGYAWPGNMRELEQCVHGVAVMGEHGVDDARRFAPAPVDEDGLGALLAEMQAGEVAADDLRDRYVTVIYSRTGSFQETANRLRIDWRTVKGVVAKHRSRGH